MHAGTREWVAQSEVVRGDCSKKGFDGGVGLGTISTLDKVWVKLTSPLC